MQAPANASTYRGERTYKVHLDGYNQVDFITGNGPSKRNAIIYFAEGTLGIRIGDFKYRFLAPAARDRPY